MVSGADELKAMQSAFDALEPLDDEQRTRALRWIIDALGVSGSVDGGAAQTGGAEGEDVVSGGDDQDTISPKRFLAEKKPTTAVERIACLAYILTHFRDTPKFKTKDLADMNTEAAGHKFANASRDVDNADRKSGFLVSAGAGKKQISVRGEALVEALPDRDAVKQALADHPFKRKASNSKKSTASK